MLIGWGVCDACSYFVQTLFGGGDSNTVVKDSLAVGVPTLVGLSPLYFLI